MLSITLIIIVTTVIVSYVSFQNPALLDKLLLHPAAMENEGEWYRFITHGFVHKDFTHLFVNMFVLFMFGEAVEGKLSHDFPMGNLIYLALYFMALVIAATPSFLKHRENYLYRSLGASGAVSAVLYCFILFDPANLLRFIFIPFFEFPAVVFGVLYLIYEWYMGRQGRGTINHDAHFYGAVFGFVFPLLFNLGYINSFIAGIEQMLNNI